MKEYYFLASLLPTLEIGHVPSLDTSDLKELLRTNLAIEDWNKTQKFYRLIDVENMRSFWAGEPFDPRGNLNHHEMEQAIAHHEWPNGESFPSYFLDYLEKHHSNEERLNHFATLISQFLSVEAAKEEEGFLKDYFEFQREMRLVMIGFRAKKLHRDIAHELQYEDSSDPIVAQILAQKDAKIYEPPFEYKELKPIFEEFSSKPIELHKELYTYEFNEILEMSGVDAFSINRILNYCARLWMVEKWLELDVSKGLNIVDTIEKEVK